MARQLNCCVFVLLLAVVTASAETQLSAVMRAYDYFLVEHTHGRTCQGFSRSRAVNYCSGFGYNMTLMPNILNHQNQTDALEQLKGLDPLVQSNCSWELPFLLCSLYFPICAETPPPVQTTVPQDELLNRPRQEEIHLTTPCRSLCQRVKDQCLPVLGRFGYGWPEDLNCSLLQDETYAEGPNGETIVCFRDPPNNFQPSFEREVGCAQRKCPQIQVKKKTFQKNKYHFAMVASLIETGVTNGRKSLHVRIRNVISKCKQHVVPRHIGRQLRGGEDALLQTDASEVCACPQLEKNTDYIITGWVVDDRLVVDSARSVLRATTNKLRKKVKKWARRNCPADN